MKCHLSIQEKLKDLRVEKGLSLEELAAETGLSKSALGSYETNDHKDISHTAIIALAKFYGVSADYLLGFSENRKECSSDISALKLGAIPNKRGRHLSGHRHCLTLCAAISRGTACDIASRARDALLAKMKRRLTSRLNFR